MKTSERKAMIERASKGPVTIATRREALLAIEVAHSVCVQPRIGCAEVWVVITKREAQTLIHMLDGSVGEGREAEIYGELVHRPEGPDFYIGG